MKYPETIENIIECLKKIPSIGTKTAERYALSILNLDKEVINLLISSLQDIDKKIKKCTICHNYTEKDVCDICSNDDRNSDVLCIVENPKDIIYIEKNNIFNGYYYVISNLISPSNGFDAAKLNISEINGIIKKRKVKEIILALKPTVEGETTSLYLSKMLENGSIIISRLALGIPMGAELDFVDSLTLEMAMENRSVINSN